MGQSTQQRNRTLVQYESRRRLHLAALVDAVTASGHTYYFGPSQTQLGEVHLAGLNICRKVLGGGVPVHT
jgi:hypothetical protein